MKNRASLLLMEQLIMVLVFALSAAICLQIFVKANTVSRDTARQDTAVTLAQNGAEVLKACGGDLQEAARILGGNVTEETLTVKGEEWDLAIRILPEEIPGLGQGDVRVLAGDAEVYCLTVSWQEVAK